MAFDETLAARVRDLLASQPRVSEKRMFGGLAFMVNGNMCMGVQREDLMVRVGPDAYARCLKLAHARDMDFTGKSLRGFVYVDKAGLKNRAALQKWVTRGLDFVATLPPK